MPMLMERLAGRPPVARPGEQEKFESWIYARIEANVRTNYPAHVIYANYADYCARCGWTATTFNNFHAMVIAWGFWSATARIDGRDVLYYRRIGFTSQSFV